MAGLTPEVITDAFQRWANGDQQGAVDVVRPAADAGEPAGLGLLAFFLYQRGEPHWREGVPYAEAAVRKGLPWVANYYLGQMQSDAAFRTRLPELLGPALQYGLQQDPIAQAYQLWSQGDHGTATRLVETINSPGLFPAAWEDFVDRARTDYNALGISVETISAKEEEAALAIDAAAVDVESRRTDVQTRTQQLLQLVEQTTNAQAQSFFDSEASENAREGRILWRWSVGLLGVATLFAVTPIAIYYIGAATNQHWLRDQNLVAAHLAPAVALGAVAGVILARARGRDRARQRAKDLSVALGTMFVYSGQIADEGERQAFLRDMGRTVIEAFLRQDSSSSESGGPSLLSALLRR